MGLRSGFRVVVTESYSDLTPLDELTPLIRTLDWSFARPGGAKELHCTVATTIDHAWQYLQADLPGRHFKHIYVQEGPFLRWEGRIMEAGLSWGTTGVALAIKAFGYWSSCRDQRVAVVDYTGGSPTVDSIIKATLTAECPDISSTQDNIAAVAGTVNLTLPVDQYTQDVILESLLPLGDSSDVKYDFWIEDGRVPFLKTRTLSQVDWEVRLQAIASGTISQAAQHLRNGADAYDGTTRQTSSSDADSQTIYPTRDAVVSVPAGTTGARALDAQGAFLEERKDPQQQSRFVITGKLTRTSGINRDWGGRSAIRAGQVLKVVDLLPRAVVSEALDNIRTFYIRETKYDAMRDVVTVIPDRPASSLAVILARQGVELDR